MAAMLLFVIGGAVTISVFAPSFPDALRSRKRMMEEKEHRAAWNAKDNLMQALNIVALDAQSYWILPPAKGGGNKNFEGYRVPAHLGSRGAGRVAVVSYRGNLAPHQHVRRGLLPELAYPRPGSAVNFDVRARLFRRSSRIPSPLPSPDAARPA